VKAADLGFGLLRYGVGGAKVWEKRAESSHIKRKNEKKRDDVLFRRGGGDKRHLFSGRVVSPEQAQAGATFQLKFRGAAERREERKKSRYAVQLKPWGSKGSGYEF